MTASEPPPPSTLVVDHNPLNVEMLGAYLEDSSSLN
jgi:CheY-like chemotaxis protein